MPGSRSCRRFHSPRLRLSRTRLADSVQCEASSPARRRRRRYPASSPPACVFGNPVQLKDESLQVAKERVLVGCSAPPSRILSGMMCGSLMVSNSGTPPSRLMTTGHRMIICACARRTNRSFALKAQRRASYNKHKLPLSHPASQAEHEHDECNPSRRFGLARESLRRQPLFRRQRAS